MRLRLAIVLVLAIALALCAAGASGGARPPLPAGFFGIVPQTPLSAQDVAYMKAGGIETVRVPLAWSQIQPTAKGGYDWTSTDEAIEVAARGGLQVLPFLCGTPRWLAKETTMPVNNARQRSAWVAFLKAAVKRYGPGGEFWREHAHEGINYEPPLPHPLPIRTWQIWNEANFFYFSYPVSPRKYARLVKLSSQTIKAVQPGAKILLTGLFGEPTAKGAKGMPAATFLKQFYRVPGIKSYFDSIALHPYAVDDETLEEMVEAIHEVTLENHDRPGLYITEMGWGSQNDFHQDAFEQGIQGQVRELRGAYGFLIDNQRRLNVKQVDWFSWKDSSGYCNFCDSVGLFHGGAGFHAKPAWRTFVGFTGGRLRP